MLNSLWIKITMEPAMVLECIKQLFNVLVLFQLLHWTAEQMAGVNIFTGLLLQVVVRQNVTPNNKVVETTEGRTGN